MNKLNIEIENFFIEGEGAFIQLSSFSAKDASFNSKILRQFLISTPTVLIFNFFF